MVWKASCSMLKRPRLPSKARVMLRSSPRSWCQCQLEIWECVLGTAARISCRQVTQWVGRVMVRAWVSRCQPRTMRCGDQWPSPVANFFLEIGSCRVAWSINSSGRKTQSMLCIRMRRTCWRCASMPWASATWSSTKTSDHARGQEEVALVAWVKSMFGPGSAACSRWVTFGYGSTATFRDGSAACSRWCSAMLFPVCSALLVRLATVSVATQKKGGELVQPIGSASGIATSGNSLGPVRNATPNVGTCCGARWIQ